MRRGVVIQAGEVAYIWASLLRLHGLFQAGSLGSVGVWLGITYRPVRLILERLERYPLKVSSEHLRACLTDFSIVYDAPSIRDIFKIEIDFLPSAAP